MKKNSATFRKSRTRVTLERMSVGTGRSAAGASVAAGPVYADSQEGGNAGEGQEERVAQARKLARAEGEREALNGARRHVQGDVAPDGPVDGAEEHLLRARGGQPGI